MDKPQTSQDVISQRKKLLRPPEKKFRQKAKDFLYDKEKKTCLTRTPLNWGSITIYYFFFLLGVAFVFFISMEIADYVAGSEEEPQYVLGDSPIGKSPALNFVPMKGKTNLLWMSEKYAEGYVKAITKMFEKYKEEHEIDMSQFGECANAPYGYPESPCFYLRMNRLIKWVPQPYKKTDKVPKTVPEDIKTLIKSSDNPRVWVSCNGSTPKDRDHIPQAFFAIQGEKGFDPKAFPYKSSESYLDPIVAIKLTDSQPKHVLYSFTCTAWAKKLNPKIANVDVSYYFE